jgi:hypothetical protein
MLTYRHPRVKAFRSVCEVGNDGTWTFLVEILTDLRLNPGMPDYDEIALRQLTEALAHWMADNEAGWTRFRFVEDWQDAPRERTHTRPA